MSIIDFSKVKSVGLNMSRLPEEYSEVECIYSVLPGGKNSSGLYVDLGISGIDGCRVCGSIDSTDGDNSLYGARNDWQAHRFGFTTDSHQANTFAFMHGSYESGIFRFPGNTNIHYIDDNCSKLGYCLIDDMDPIKITSPTDVSTETLHLFNDNCARGYYYYGACTIYSAEFYKNQVLVSYPVPCKRKADKKPGFYDLVQKKFLTEVVMKGTAELKAGRELSPEVIQIKMGDTVLWNKPTT